jgi:hypothetical protein
VDCVTRTRYLPIPLLACRNATHTPASAELLFSATQGAVGQLTGQRAALPAAGLGMPAMRARGRRAAEARCHDDGTYGRERNEVWLGILIRQQHFVILVSV